MIRFRLISALLFFLPMNQAVFLVGICMDFPASRSGYSSGEVRERCVVVFCSSSDPFAVIDDYLDRVVTLVSFIVSPMQQDM